MNEKKPAYKITLPLMVVLFVVGCALIAIGKDNQSLQMAGGLAVIASVPLIIVSVISAIRTTIRNRSVRKEAVILAGPTQPISETNSTNEKNAAPTVLSKVASTKGPQFKTETHKVAGVSYRQKEIQSLAKYNNGYDMTKKDIEEVYGKYERVHQYEFDIKKAELIPEPDNEFGDNAIKVVADGVHIGYIKSGSAAHVKKLIDNNLIQQIRIEISGGKNKMIYEDGSMIKDEIGYYARVILKTAIQ